MSAATAAATILQDAESFLVEVRVSGAAPKDLATRLESRLASLSAREWDLFRAAVLRFARTLAGKMGEADLWKVLLDALAEAREAAAKPSDHFDMLISVLTDRLLLFVDDDVIDGGDGDKGAQKEASRPEAADPEMVELFIAEATEQLQEIESCVLRLSEGGEVLNRLFRAMHTLKGSSGMVGLRSFNRLAHAAEETLDAVRAGRIKPTSALEEMILIVKDQLQAGIDRLERGEDPESDVEDIIVKIRRLSEGGGAGDGDSPPARKNSSDGGPAQPAASPVEQTVSKKEQSGTIRINNQKLDEVFERMGEAVIGRIRLEARLAHLGHVIGEQETEEWRGRVKEAHESLRAACEEYGRAHSSLQERVTSLRLAPISTVFNRFPRVVRDTSRQLGKEIDLQITGGDVEIDKSICEAMLDPLIHILRNSIDHGIESPSARIECGKLPAGQIHFSASYQGDRVVIEISDDGQGIDVAKVSAKAIEKKIVTAEELARLDEKERLLLIFRPGFSTAESVTAISGRGVGMDVVRNVIERLKGSVELVSIFGEGTRVRLYLPLTLALVNLLLVGVGGETVAIPLYVVRETLRLKRDEIERAADRQVISVRGSYLPLISLADVLGLSETLGETIPIVVVEVMGETAAFTVDRFYDKREVILKQMGELLVEAPFVSGATILGDGRVVPVLDPVSILREASRGKKTSSAESAQVGRGKKVLVVEDSSAMSKHIVGILRRAGYLPTPAEDGVAALAILRKEHFDIVSTDIEMPRMDGYEFCRNVRENPLWETLPVMAVTSHADKVDRIKGFGAGFDEYLTKPVDEKVYLATIERLLTRRT